MWLDRLSNQPSPSGTPPPQGRASISSAARRSYLAPGPGAARPAFSPRSSSLSIASSNSSTPNLPAIARLPNGSGLRKQISAQAPEDVPDPLDVLEGILGASVKSRGPSGVGKEGDNGGLTKPEQLVEDIDFGGLSLFAYANAPRARKSSNVHTRIAQSAEEFDREKDKFEDLHQSILGADNVLDSVEDYLTHFKADLGAVSAEIETLQSRSIALSTKLENRKVVEKLIGPTVEELSLPAAVVQKIAEGPIDEGFVHALSELEKRSKSLDKASSDNQVTIKALENSRPLIEDLTNKALERIRDYIVAQIKAIRSPSMNAQIIQQDGFVKYRELYAFLSKHNPQLAEDICQAYVNTMRWYYLSHFTKYQKALEKLRLHAIDKYDLLGQEDTSKRGPLLGASRAPFAQYDPFSIGRRVDILKYPSHTAITAYLAEEDKATHHLEIIFRAFDLALVDNASFEYTFLLSFFGPSQSTPSLTRRFNAIFQPTFALGQSVTKQLVENTTDALGVLLCVRLNQHFAFEAQRRKVPVIEGYINATSMLLWPRFQQIIDQHCDSLRRLTTSLPNRPITTASSLLAGVGGGSSQSSSTGIAAAQSAAPHPVTQKFSSFMMGILTLSSEAGDDEPIANSLGRLRSDMEALLTKLSKTVSDTRKRERFLQNNYSLVVTILGDGEGRLADETRQHFETLKNAFGS